MDFNTLIEQVQEWSRNKGLDKAAPEKQFLKVIEEVGEVAAAMARNDREELVDGLGDTFVTLIILCQQLGVAPHEALDTAYGVIFKRTGKMIDGVFVKSEDL
ncbi:hypothetical protein KMDAMLD_00012 [Enterococcus phage vB_OCPT_PG11]|nr:hypothetical protein KMDAMLD_00012 [Enterococcus phage vB_OCPT_PG11]